MQFARNMPVVSTVTTLAELLDHLDKSLMTNPALQSRLASNALKWLRLSEQMETSLNLCGMRYSEFLVFARMATNILTSGLAAIPDTPMMKHNANSTSGAPKQKDRPP